MAHARRSPTTTPPAYPRALEQALPLEDGRVVFVRPIVPEDAGVLADEIEEADTETLYHRFFSPSVKLDDTQLRHLTELDYTSSFALVALTGDGEGVSVVRYAALPEHPGWAEVAFTVKRGWRRAAIATMLYRIVETRARDCGLCGFVAFHLAENEAAAGLLDRLAFDVVGTAGGIVETRKRLGDARCALTPRRP